MISKERPLLLLSILIPVALFAGGLWLLGEKAWRENRFVPVLQGSSQAN